MFANLVTTADAAAAVVKYQAIYDAHLLFGNKEKAKHIKPKLAAAKRRVEELAKPVLKAVGKVAEAAEDLLTTGDPAKMDQLLKSGVSATVEVAESAAQVISTGETTKAESLFKPTFFNRAGVVNLDRKTTGDLTGVYFLAALEAIGRAILLPFVALYELFRAACEDGTVDMKPYLHTFTQSVTLEA